MVRGLLIAGLLVLAAGCRPPYSSEIADMTVLAEELPPRGTPLVELQAWFDAAGYVEGPTVRQSRAELTRRPGAPLVYARAEDRLWWRTRQRTIRDFCVTRRVVYYRLAPGGALVEAIPAHRSQC